MALRTLLAGAVSLTALASFAAPVYADTTTSTTQPGLGILPTTTSTTTTTTTTLPPAPPTTAARKPSPKRPSTTTSSTTSTTTAKPGKTASPATGVPDIPVASSPTTVPKNAKNAKKGQKPPPAPNPAPVLGEVQQYVSQVSAINQYKADKNLVQAAQQRLVTQSASVADAAAGVRRASASLHAARARLATAAANLRTLAVAAYTGVGYTSTQTPGGGFETTDSKEMLQIISKRIINGDVDAKVDVAHNVTSTKAAEKAYHRTVAALDQDEAAVAAAQHTLLVAKAMATSGGTSPGGTSGTTTSLTGPNPPAANVPSPTILGTPILSAQEMAAWFASTGEKANTTVPIAQLAQDYQTWGQKLGVRDDIAFAQSIIETGYFSFPAGGQLTGQDNNYAGIGACDSCAKGWSFPTASAGAAAQMELLYKYATTAPIPSSVPNLIGAAGVGGCCSTWSQLAGKWATSTVYGISIMTVYQQMLAWAIPRREVTAGLVAAKTPAHAAGSPQTSSNKPQT